MSISTLEEALKLLPDRPGCYLFKDREGNVLYVGKAASLRSRVRSYFQEGGGHSPRTRLMVVRVYDAVRDGRPDPESSTAPATPPRAADRRHAGTPARSSETARIAPAPVNVTNGST